MVGNELEEDEDLIDNSFEQVDLNEENEKVEIIEKPVEKPVIEPEKPVKIVEEPIKNIQLKEQVEEKDDFDDFVADWHKLDWQEARKVIMSLTDLKKIKWIVYNEKLPILVNEAKRKQKTLNG